MRNKILPILFALLAPLLVQSQVDTNTEMKKLLVLSLKELMDINVVTATGSAQKINEAPSTMNVITAQQIKERGYEQLEDALRDVPGIDFIHTNGYVPTLIYFRGMYGAENLRALLMINGIPENNIIGSNDMAGPAYNLHNVERIEVIWGPASALYGANAFGGVINIITKTGANINGFQAEKGFGTFNTSVDKVQFGINKSNFDIALSGSLYSTDGPKFTNRDPNYTASYVDKAYSFNAVISYSGKQLKSTLGARIYNTPMGWGTFLNSPTVFLGLPPQGYNNSGVFGLIARDVRGEKSGLQETYARTFYIQEEFKPNDKLNFTSRLVYRETGIGEKSYAYVTLDGRKLYRVPTASYSNRVEGEVIANYNSAGNKYQFSAGVQYYRENIERGSRGINVDSTTVFLLDGRDTLLNLYSTFKERLYDIRNNFGSFVQFVLNTKMLTKTSFTIGARYDYNNYYGNPVSPRLAVVSQPNKKLTLKLLFGIAYRAPTNTEIYQTSPDFKLKIEKARTFEANIIYHQSPKVLWQINGFRNELRDVIVLGNLVNLNPDKNPGEFNINGAEIKLDVLFSNVASAFANFTYQNAVGKNLITGLVRKLSGVASVKGNFGVTLKKENLFTFNITGNWVGTRQTPRTDPYGPVAGYFLTNAVLSTEKFFEGRVHASIAVHNLFNVKYLDPGFRTADGIIYSTVLEQPGINCLFKVGVTL
ncbi:MAG: TonB-dependent receptor plug domain-containing protein [Ferruginibacter sp.]